MITPSIKACYAVQSLMWLFNFDSWLLFVTKSLFNSNSRSTFILSGIVQCGFSVAGFQVKKRKRSEVNAMTRERRTPLPPKKQATIIEEEAKLFWTERLFSAKSRQHWWQKRGEKSHLFAWTIQSGSDRLSVRRVAITKKHPHIHIRYAQYSTFKLSEH